MCVCVCGGGVLVLWKEHASLYPTIAKLASKIILCMFCAPWLFRLSGHIALQARASLNPEKAIMLVLLVKKMN